MPLEPRILALRRLMQLDCCDVIFKASLSYIVDSRPALGYRLKLCHHHHHHHRHHHHHHHHHHSSNANPTKGPWLAFNADLPSSTTALSATRLSCFRTMLVPAKQGYRRNESGPEDAGSRKKEASQGSPVPRSRVSPPQLY